MSYELAVIEAYANPSDNELVLDTLEFHHPAFQDEFGNPSAIRVVCMQEGWDLKLESTAPLSPGQYVRFEPVPFTINKPDFAENEVPFLQISISNISREITRQLELAISQTVAIRVIYRNYLASDTSGPQLDPVIEMQLTSVEASTMSVTGTATLSDVHNWPFPSQRYTPERFPGLVR